MMNTVNVCLWIVSLLFTCILAQDYICDPKTQYFNGSTCLNCTVCRFDEREIDFCGPNVDRVCERRCRSEFEYVPAEHRCILSCDACESGSCVTGELRCLCLPQKCFRDDDTLCERTICVDATEPDDITAPPPGSSQNNLPAWGVGVISIGVAIGIIAFSGIVVILYKALLNRYRQCNNITTPYSRNT